MLQIFLARFMKTCNVYSRICIESPRSIKKTAAEKYSKQSI